MNRRSFILLLLGLSLCWGVGANFAPPELKVALDTVIDQAIENKKLVGAVVLVSRDGKIIYERGAGMIDREAHRAMPADAIFRLASMSKPLVSVAALYLLDQGLISLDDPVTKYIPDFQPKLNDGSEATITIRNLLTHTSGLSYGFLEPVDGPYHQLHVSDGLDDVGITLTENVHRLGQAPLLFKPGTTWNYSLSIDVLGEVLARASGKTLPEIVREVLTEPLKMDETNFVTIASERLTVPYALATPEPVRMTDPFEYPMGISPIVYSPGRAVDPTAFPSGGAGMMSTSHDYLKFMEAIRTNSTGLSEETAKLITTNQIGDMPVNLAGEGYGWSMGFSYLKDPVKANTPCKVGTLGWSGAYGSSFWIDPQSKLSVIILTNTVMPFTETFFNDVRSAIYSSMPGI